MWIVVLLLLAALAWVCIGAAFFAWCEDLSPTATPPERVWILVAYVALWPLLWVVSYME